jgi:hypothetical protein
VHYAKIEKSHSGCRLELFDGDLGQLEDESFADLYTLNFHLQTLASKYRISEGLLVVHDKDASRSTCRLQKAKTLSLSASVFTKVALGHCNFERGMAHGTVGPAAPAEIFPFKAASAVGAL